MRQLDLFGPAVVSRRELRERKKLLGMLRQAAKPDAAPGPMGLSRPQIKMLMRPLPRITVPW